MVNPEMVIGLEVVSGLRAVYVVPSVEYLWLVIADPPSEPAVKLTVSEPSPAVTDVMVGAAGTLAGQ